MRKIKYLWPLLFLVLFQGKLIAQDHHDHHNHQSIDMTVASIQDSGNKKIVRIKLLHQSDGKPVTLADLKEIHTERVHFLIIDDGLEDYHHVHPLALQQPGLYEFEWSPKQEGNYNLWADLFPLATNAQEYVMVPLVSGKKDSKIVRSPRYQAKAEGYTFDLSLSPKTPKVHKHSMGTIRVTDSRNEPVTELEPIMGAFAHLVGFYDDFETIAHMHPMGKEPQKSHERAGPKLKFHLEPSQKGFMKLFAQVVIKGKEIIVPFGLQIQ